MVVKGMITAETLAKIPLFASIGEHEREVIAARAADVSLQAGEWLIHEGETPSFFGILEGRLTVLKIFGSVAQKVNQYGPGDFFGEVPLLLGAPAVAGVRAETASRLVRLEAVDFRELIVHCSKLNQEVLGAMAQRVRALQQVMLETPVSVVTIVGNRWDPDCHGLRDFLVRNHVAFHWLEPDEAAADASIDRELLDVQAFPLLIFPDGTHLGHATEYRTVAERLGLRTTPTPDTTYDVAIVGGGPAGLAAAVYGASEGLRTILIEREAPGGQAGTSSRIENYLGFPAGLSGDDLSTRALKQAKRFGAEVVVARAVSSVELSSVPLGAHTLILDGGDRIDAHAIVVATGVTWRRLALPGAEALLGRGIYYGAARTEALATRGKDVFLIGGGNSAGQAAMFFANYARSVTVLVRGERLATSMSHYLTEQLDTKSNVRVETLSEVVAIEGEGHLEAIVVQHARTGEHRRYVTDGLFVFIGADAETSWLPETIVRDQLGYICSGRDLADLDYPSAPRWPLKRSPYLLETSIPGVFVAGDVRHGSIKRVASSVGEGSMSIALVHAYLDELPARSFEPVG